MMITTPFPVPVSFSVATEATFPVVMMNSYDNDMKTVTTYASASYDIDSSSSAIYDEDLSAAVTIMITVFVDRTSEK